MTVQNDNGPETGLAPRLDVRNHSPTGFNHGYGGSGPSQLALAIVLDFTGDREFTEDTYQAFKREVIAKLPMDENWVLTHEQVAQALVPLGWVTA